MKHFPLARAAELLELILRGRLPADQQMQAYFRKHRNMGVNDRGFVAETVYGCLRRKRLLEHFLGPSPAAQDTVAAYLAAVQGWSARALEQAGCRPGIREQVAHIRATDVSALPAAVRADMPDWLYERLAAQLGEAETLALAAALNQPAPVDLRANTLKTTPAEAAALLEQEGYPTEPGALSPVCLRRQARSPLFKTRAFSEGLIEIQDEGSQLLAPLLEPRRGEMVVDFCAGAGGKTLHLGALMDNTGTLYAFDVSARRLDQLKPRLRRAGLDTVRSVVIEHERDPRVLRLRGKIDRVLVDAPCTGLGTLRRNPDIKWRAHALDEITALQRRILAAAAELVKPGGRLVYATCSPLHEENEAVIEAFLAEQPEFSILPAGAILARRHVPISLPETTPALHLYSHRHPTDTYYAVALERAPRA
ncbi:MAG: RsmB/NOP family class I SAM-dependent RNA methyltransferase [Gammaproteobacteria bacterium]|nr:RsmB/NOP family class I SAM-dependent RNA methyltransferase [Gammaproteobacteria bacterium]